MSAADVTLPGDIPGLPRQCSPVAAVKSAGTGLFRQDNARGVVLDLRADGPPGYMLVAFAGRSPFWAPTKYLALDLTDATGRAHAAWWRAAREVPEGYTLAAATWRRAPAQPSCGWELAWFARGERDQTLSSAWWSGVRRSPVPAGLLADLDPDDPRLLPDGSRWVDAESLRRVCLRAAGRAP